MITPLLLLAESDFPTLISALRSRRLCAPFSHVVIERLLGHSVSPEIMNAFDEFGRMNFSWEQLASVFELLQHDRRRRPRLEDAIDLVASGPEAQGVPNRDTRVVVRELFANAHKSVFIAGYAIYQGKMVFQALAERMTALSHLKVHLILEIHRPPGDTSLSSVIVQRFAERFHTQQWPSNAPLPQVFYDPRSLEISSNEKSVMHAKCIVVDGCQLFVSSANFTEAAQNRNLEIGILIRSPSHAENLARHFNSLISQGALLEVPMV